MSRLIFLALLGTALAQEYTVNVVDIKQVPAANNTRIIGGTEATIESFPFAVQIIYTSQLLCGGSLITRQHVLSAAHCFVTNQGVMVQPSSLTVRAGTQLTNSGGRTFRVSFIILHERYNMPPRDNDVAILLLTSRVSTSSKIAVGAIPMQGNTVPDNSALTYVGWGVTQVNSQVAAPSLRRVDVQKINQTVCTTRYAQLWAQGAPFIVTDNMICAGNIAIGGRDACQGDSGGPVVYNNVIVGIVSWGYSCGHPVYPGVNAFVPNYNIWIQNTVQRYNAGSAISPLSALILLVAAISTKMLNIC